MLIAVTATFLVLQSSSAQEAKRSDFVSMASHVVGAYQPASQENTPEAMVAAAEKLVASLSEEQQKEIQHPLDSPERREWTNLPARPDAGGVRMGDMNEQQVQNVCDVMAAMLSEQGYKKMVDIMLADDQLLKGGNPRRGFGTEEFSVVVFGKPAVDGSWAFQIDGHHVGVNVSVNGSELTLAPSFIGTQPEAFSIAKKQYEPFAGETGDAYALVATLSDEQIKAAILQPQRARIVTGPGNDGKVPKAKGVACSTFDERQKALLMKLIANWVNDLPKTHAEKRMEQLEDEIDQMKFAWNGGKAPGSDISYTIQGPTLIIEYACQDLGGNPLAHLHSMYRDPTNDYGKQLD